MDSRNTKRPGLSLMELMIVLVVLVAIAAIVVPLMGDSSEEAKRRATLITMHRLRDAILGTAEIPGYRTDLRGAYLLNDIKLATGMPGQIQDLFIQPSAAPTFDIDTKRGWRGPYLQHPTGLLSNGDPAVVDGWGNPIVIQWPSSSDGEPADKYFRLVSAGQRSGSAGYLIETPPGETMPTRKWSGNPSTVDQRGNDIILFLRTVDLYPAEPEQ